MLLMISIIIIGFILFTNTYLKHNVYLQHVKFEISILGLKFEFKTKEKGSHPTKD